MDLDTDQRAEELFQQAADLPPDERARFLRERCGGGSGGDTDTALLARVRTLLEHHDAASDTFLAGQQPADVGKRIGPYTLLRVLGEGGMGTVYEAEQDRPRRLVALKLIRPGFMSEVMVRRFEYEADVLGRLEHPGIARVYHAGLLETPAGPQPFFAMELVRGTRLDEWVRQHNPPTKRRLELLIAVCDAVHHAHTKGVIHRDLKPANIHVGEDGQPKVLDFGVARATDSDIQSATMHTESGQIIGTLPYMAPEQASGRVRELDTSSDVYALGVIAYELLSGTMPYELEGKALHEAVRVICEQEPTRLSNVDRNLRGDVETIVQKALEKDKTRRYQTGGELAADVKRYLDYEPIAARPPGTWYQLHKFAKRNKLLVGGVAAMLLLLAGGVVTSTFFAVRAERQRVVAQAEKVRADEQAAVANAVNEFLGDMLSAADPNRLLGEKVTVLEATQEAIKKLDSGALKDQPRVESAVRHTIGLTQATLGRFDDARASLRVALEIDRKTLPADHPDIASSIERLALVLEDHGDFAEAEPLLRDALRIRRKVLPAGHPEIAVSLSNLGKMLSSLGQEKESETLLREALDISRKALPADDPTIGVRLNNLAMVLNAQGRLSEAESLYREGLGIFRKKLPVGHPEIASMLSNLAMLLEDQDKWDEAEQLLQEVLQIRRNAMPAGHPDIALSLDYLANVRMHQRRFDDAELLQREAVEICRKALPVGHWDTLNSLNNLAVLLWEQERFADAEPILAEVYALVPKSQVDPRRAAAYVACYGPCLVKLGKYEQAEGPLREAYRRLEETGRDDHALRLVVSGFIGMCDHTNRPEEAAKWRAELARLRAATQPASLPTTQPAIAPTR